MLVLTRKTDEAIQIGDCITLKVISIHGCRVKLGIECPREIPVLRQELADELQWSPPGAHEVMLAAEAVTA